MKLQFPCSYSRVYNTQPLCGWSRPIRMHTWIAWNRWQRSSHGIDNMSLPLVRGSSVTKRDAGACSVPVSCTQSCQLSAQGWSIVDIPMLYPLQLQSCAHTPVFCCCWILVGWLLFFVCLFFLVGWLMFLATTTSSSQFSLFLHVFMLLLHLWTL